MPVVPIHLTDRAVRGLSPRDRRYKVSDIQVRGLAVVVAPTGRKSWIVNVEVSGKRTSRTIGSYPELSLAEARKEARQLLESPIVAKGVDKVLFRDLAEQFIELYAKPRKRTWEQDRDHLRRDLLPALGKRPIAEIGRVELQDLLAKIAKRAPTVANNIHSLLSKMFRWAVQRDLLDRSPMSDGAVPKPAPKRRGRRVLLREEIRQLWKVWAEEGRPISAAALLWTLTGQRRSEILELRWSEVHLDEDPHLEIPEDRMKNKRPHRLPLSSAAVEILEAMQAVSGDSPFVFPGHGTDGPISSTNTAMRRWKKKSGLTDWDQRAIRRSVATWLAELGTPHHVIDVILAHVPAARDTTRANYIRYSYQAEAREALEELSGWLREAAGCVETWAPS